ncbi:uncharacterized protein C2845_PM01G34660 [Panicum miliaceum]|uniref:Uncharacterized protein n=1 Tax=Panicum miliaceum TaxID=4540 RepID=A0A3L6TKB3_PANMI|nr:uncharacterized protein C2845_PM01G34660 [Panicum miliaceum]
MECLIGCENGCCDGDYLELCDIPMCENGTVNKVKECTRFKHRGLQNEESLGIMFEDLRNTGDDHRCASSGARPSQTNLDCDASPINLDDEDEANNDDDSEPKEVTPTSVREERSDNSSHKIDESDSDDDEWTVKTLALLRGAQNIQFMTAMLASKYFLTYHDKNKNRTPSQSGFG